MPKMMRLRCKRRKGTLEAGEVHEEEAAARRIAV